MNKRKVEVMIKRNRARLEDSEANILKALLDCGEVEGAYKGLIKILKQQH